MWSSLLKYAWCKQFSKKLKGTIFPKWLHWIGLEAGLKRTNNSQTKTLSLSVTRAVRHLPFSFSIRRYYLFILVPFLVFKSHVFLKWFVRVPGWSWMFCAPGFIDAHLDANIKNFPRPMNGANGLGNSWSAYNHKVVFLIIMLHLQCVFRDPEIHSMINYFGFRFITPTDLNTKSTFCICWLILRKLVI